MRFFKLLALVLVPGLEPAAFSRPSAPAGDKPAPLAAARVFDQHCAGCHGHSGTGGTFPGLLMFAPNFSRPAWQAKNTDAQITAAITKGRRLMPAFEGRLSKEEIAGLAAYIRKLKHP